jgi:glycosyltransferase involved in cell wall biosynthesis
VRYLREEFEVRILCWSNGEVAEALRGEGATVLEAPSLYRAGRVLVLPGLLSIYKEIKQYAPDSVISMFLWSDFLTAGAVSLHRWLGKRTPHLVHIAGDPVPRSYTFSLPRAVHGLQTRIYSRMVKRSLRQADRVICINDHDRDLVRSKFGLSNGQVQVIPIGIEMSPFNPRTGCHDPFTFGVVSRLSRVKNIDVIIRMVKRILESGRNCGLAIFGDGPEKVHLEKLVFETGLENRVTFRGWVAKPSAAFDAIDCLLMYSDTEGTPRAILEAGARGVPVIARDVGGISGTVRHEKTGYLVNTEDELFYWMARVIDFTAESIIMGHELRRLIERKHSIHVEVAHLKVLLESVC